MNLVIAVVRMRRHLPIVTDSRSPEAIRRVTVRVDTPRESAVSLTVNNCVGWLIVICFLIRLGTNKRVLYSKK